PSMWCGMRCCGGCLASMFTSAIANRPFLPPSCCRLIPLHVVVPGLDEDVVKTFKEKFEESVLRNDGGFYCPKRECSAWISGAQVDEVEEALLWVVSCKKCNTKACTECHGEEHGGDKCPERDDHGAAALLQSLDQWGYKQCPRCKNAVRRMFGCSHMQCGWCAVNFCWWCLKSLSQCERDGCTHTRGESELDDYSDLGLEEKNESEEKRPSYSDTPRNLDGHSQAYWEASNLNFGEEPEEQKHNFFNCSHKW
ncbi:hypothetical protein NA57DRAFT_26502, partial [Rhizodiscina lignyota]